VEVFRLERTLAIARLSLCGLALVATQADSTEPERFARLVTLLLCGWLACSVVILALLMHRQHVGWRGGLLIHLGDLFWPTVLTAFSLGPSSPLFIFFTFAIVAAAFRWGFPETLMTVFASILILLAQGCLMTASTQPFSELHADEYELNRMILRLSYLLITGVLIGLLGESAKERRAESAAVMRLLRSIRAEHRVADNLGFMLRESRHIFGASRTCLVAEEQSTGRVYLWSGGEGPAATMAPPEPGVNRGCLLRDWPSTFFCRQGLRGVTLQALAGNGLQRSRLKEWSFAALFGEDTESLLAVRCELGRQWVVRLIAINPRISGHVENALRFAETMMRQGAGAFYNVYLLRRTRARTGAMERALVARELHDGVIQSLISAEMRVDVLRRKDERLGGRLGGELGEVQDLLRMEVFRLRDLMQQLRPVDLSPAQLLDFLADTVERFRRDSGIVARFVAGEHEEINLTPHVCRELVRILQEALVNVRKHAAAANVLVTFDRAEPGNWLLAVKDDGQGFDFEGRVEYDGPMIDPAGPVVIQERVRAIGGKLSIVSQRGHGSAVEVVLTQRGNIHAN
jgi:signal transduction histidine kinase